MGDNHRLLFETKITPPSNAFNRKAMRVGGIISVVFAGIFFALFFLTKLFPMTSSILISSPLLIIGLILIVISFVKKEAPRLSWLYIYDDEIRYQASNGKGEFSLDPNNLRSVRFFSKGTTFGLILNGQYVIPYLPEGDPSVRKLKEIEGENRNAAGGPTRKRGSNVETKKELPAEENDTFDIFGDNR